MSGRNRYFAILIILLIVGSSCAGSPPIYQANLARTGTGITGETPLASRRDIRARFIKGEMKVDIYPHRGEGYIDLALRISNKPKRWQSLKKWNSNRRFPQTGVPIRVPFAFLNAKYRLAAVKDLFKKDRLTTTGWVHRVTYKGETMWFIAEVFTGDGANFPALQKANGLRKGQAIGLGRKIVIPLKLLGDEFSNAVLDHPDLSFEKGRDGKLYAVYKLKRGEALYSAVIVRFTGRVDARDVDEMSKKILRINGLRDPRKIPVGKKIKIPFDDLSEDFLTGGAPDRVVKVSRNNRGAGLHVILDPGHGGSDPGVIKHGVTEDELAYDIMLRLRRALEKHGVRVYPTISDPKHSGRPVNSNRLSNGKGERLNTTPPYTIRDVRTSVNMRVYLVNAIYRRLKKKKIPDDNMFLVSIHMDHLHPSMSGSMIYYPNAAERSRSFKARGGIYRRYAESRIGKIVFHTGSIRKAESFSYDFSRQLVAAFKRSGIPVHSHRPIRPFVYRRNRKWTPGIIRYSQVPTSVLVEVVNMANSRDFRRIRDYKFRQRVAEAIARAIIL